MFKRFKRWHADLTDVKAMEAEMLLLIKSREEWFRKSAQHQREAEAASPRMRWYTERENDVQLLLGQLRTVELPVDVAALAKSVADFELVE